MSTSTTPTHPTPATAFANGVTAERRRMATLLLTRATAAQARAEAARDGDPEAWGRAMGEAEALTQLAAELIPEVAS